MSFFPLTTPRLSFWISQYYIQTSFPHIFKPYLRRQLQIYRSLYQPTHFSVLAAEKSQGDVALEEEKGLSAELAGDGNAKETETLDDANGDADMNVAEDGEDDETGIECQCCFADYPFVRAFLLARFTLF